MFIPYNTDAPLYHFPYATIGTIIVNVLLYIPVFVLPDAYEGQAKVRLSPAAREVAREIRESIRHVTENEDFKENLPPLSEAQQEMLKALEKLEGNEEDASDETTTIWRLMTVEFGKIRPWQWLTANYMHAGFLHLLGNMFVLWGFGLIVEGKIGWWRFLLLYNGIGTLGWGFIQIVMLGASDDIGLGASLAIFGILAISMIWAPANEMECVLILFPLWLYPIMFETPVMTVAMISLFIQIAVSGLQIASQASDGRWIGLTSELLHLTGAAIGVAVGIWMVKKNLVDCEGWDAFSVMQGKHTKTIQDDREDVQDELAKILQQERDRFTPSAPMVTPTPKSSPMPVASIARPGVSESLTIQFRALVAAGQTQEAREFYKTSVATFPQWLLPEPEYVSLISLMRKQKQWELAASAMEDYFDRYSEREATIRMALAQVLFQALHRPREAFHHFEMINENLLDATQRQNYIKLRSALASKGGGTWK